MFADSPRLFMPAASCRRAPQFCDTRRRHQILRLAEARRHRDRLPLKVPALINRSQRREAIHDLRAPPPNAPPHRQPAAMTLPNVDKSGRM